jgi:hypothetical protein
VTLRGSDKHLVVGSAPLPDTFAKMDDAWLFAQHRRHVDWLDQRALS